MPAPLKKMTNLTEELDKVSKNIINLQLKQHNIQHNIIEIKSNIIHLHKMIDNNLQLHKRISPAMLNKLRELNMMLHKQNAEQWVLTTDLINAQTKQITLMRQVKNEQLLAGKVQPNYMLFHQSPVMMVPPTVRQQKITTQQKPINIQQQQPEQFLTSEQIEIARAYFANYPTAKKLSKKTTLTINHTRQVKLPYSVIKSTDGKLYAIYAAKDTYKPKGIKGLLGKGSYGRVKLAQSLDDGTIIAAKIQSINSTANAKVSDIKKEENIQQAVNQYLGSGKRQDSKYQNKTKYYTFSKFIEGQSLANYFKNNYSLSVEQKLKVILEVLKATQELHEKNIIHADLSFNNILYDQKTGKATIIDFGFAGKANANNFIELPFRVPFDPRRYYAPECASGRANYRSDIYSLGKWIEWYVAGADPFLRNLSSQMLATDPFKRPNATLCIEQIENYLSKMQPHQKFK